MKRPSIKALSLLLLTLVFSTSIFYITDYHLCRVYVEKKYCSSIYLLIFVFINLSIPQFPFLLIYLSIYLILHLSLTLLRLTFWGQRWLSIFFHFLYKTRPAICYIRSWLLVELSYFCFFFHSSVISNNRSSINCSSKRVINVAVSVVLILTVAVTGMILVQ